MSHTRTKGRVVESAGIRFYRKRSGPDDWHNRPWSGTGWWPTRYRPIARAWNGSSLSF